MSVENGMMDVQTSAGVERRPVAYVDMNFRRGIGQCVPMTYQNERVYYSVTGKAFVAPAPESRRDFDLSPALYDGSTAAFAAMAAACMGEKGD